jgi:hypothetical protein
MQKIGEVESFGDQFEVESTMYNYPEHNENHPKSKPLQQQKSDK